MPNWTLIGSILLPNTGGWVGALTMTGQVKNMDGTAWYQTIKKPSWNPPNWVFGPAWTALYSGMGYASYIVYRDCGGFTDKAVLPLALYGGHLALNWMWTPVFFKFHQIGLDFTALLFAVDGHLRFAALIQKQCSKAFIHIVALDAAAVACAISFYQVNRNAGFLMAPYLAWLGFASCLNYAIWKLNKDDKKD